MQMTESAQVRMHGTSSTVPVIAASDNHRLPCAQKMSPGTLYLVLQMFTFLQPKLLEGEDLNAEAYSRVGDKKICNAVLGRTKYKKRGGCMEVWK